VLTADEQLAVAEGLAAGRVEAWNALYAAYAEDAWRYAARLLGQNRDGVGDVVQETFLAAARSARSFDAKRGTLRSWLIGIVHVQAAQYWRRRARAARDGDVLSRERRERDAGSDAEQALLRCEQAEHVRRVLAEMPADYAWLLVSKYVEERPIAAIVQELSAGTEAVRSKLARARRLFRTAMSRKKSELVNGEW
jgi:RNA polymerase sigma-70 factor (ECF subfamily)